MLVFPNSFYCHYSRCGRNSSNHAFWQIWSSFALNGSDGKHLGTFRQIKLLLIKFVRWKAAIAHHHWSIWDFCASQASLILHRDAPVQHDCTINVIPIRLIHPTSEKANVWRLVHLPEWTFTTFFLSFDIFCPLILYIYVVGRCPIWKIRCRFESFQRRLINLSLSPTIESLIPCNPDLV